MKEDQKPNNPYMLQLMLRQIHDEVLDEMPERCGSPRQFAVGHGETGHGDGRELGDHQEFFLFRKFLMLVYV